MGVRVLLWGMHIGGEIYTFRLPILHTDVIFLSLSGFTDTGFTDTGIDDVADDAFSSYNCRRYFKKDQFREGNQDLIEF